MVDPSQMQQGAPPMGGAPGGMPGGMPPGGPGAPMDPMALLAALKAMKKSGPPHHKAKAKGKKGK